MFLGSRAAGDSPRWSLRHPGPIETLKYDTSKNRNFIKIFLLMNGRNHWISQNLTIQFNFPWNQQMRNILEYRFHTGTSCFELSDFEKYSKYHPKLNEKLVSSARRAKPDLARHAPASIITLQAELYESLFLRHQSRQGLTTMTPEAPRHHRSSKNWNFLKIFFSSVFHNQIRPFWAHF